jgi:hypothetical protein
MQHPSITSANHLILFLEQNVSLIFGIIRENVTVPYTKMEGLFQ